MKLRGENDLRVRASGVGERGLAPPTEASSWLPRSPGQFTCVKKYDKMAVPHAFSFCPLQRRQAGSQRSGNAITTTRATPVAACSLVRAARSSPSPAQSPRGSKVEATARQMYIRGGKIKSIASHAMQLDRSTGPPAGEWSHARTVARAETYKRTCRRGLRRPIRLRDDPDPLGRSPMPPPRRRGHAPPPHSSR
jgi:hypothetical protein